MSTEFHEALSIDVDAPITMEHLKIPINGRKTNYQFSLHRRYQETTDRATFGQLIDFATRGGVDNMTHIPVTYYREKIVEEYYQYEQPGELDIPMIVKAGMNSYQAIYVTYEAELTRPDNSLKYVVSNTIFPEFHHDNPYGPLKRKSRVRIDGLPVFLRIDDWKEPYNPQKKSRPQTLTIFRGQWKETPFTVEEGNSTELRYTDQFSGLWTEKWHLIERRGGNGKLYKDFDWVDVALTGNWATF